MANLSSNPWIELAVLAPGQSHYWCFEQPRDLHGWVFQATAHPEVADDEFAPAENRVEVSELFVLGKRAAILTAKRSSQVNITVTNYSGHWAPYSLWVVAIPASHGQQALSVPVTRISARSPKHKARVEPPSNLKILVVYDEYGRVRSVAVSNLNTPGHATLRVQRGESLIEVEEPAVDLAELRRHPQDVCEKLQLD
jgi:hypothetical protein